MLITNKFLDNIFLKLKSPCLKFIKFLSQDKNLNFTEEWFQHICLFIPKCKHLAPRLKSHLKGWVGVSLSFPFFLILQGTRISADSAVFVQAADLPQLSFLDIWEPRPKTVYIPFHVTIDFWIGYGPTYTPKHTLLNLMVFKHDILTPPSPASNEFDALDWIPGHLINRQF